jgi:hypothetical protein
MSRGRPTFTEISRAITYSPTAGQRFAQPVEILRGSVRRQRIGYAARRITRRAFGDDAQLAARSRLSLKLRSS